MTAPEIPSPQVLGPYAVRAADADAVLDGAAVAEAALSPLEIAGAGAVACMQGILTADIEKPGDGGYGYAGVLTPKGMIVTDLWVARTAGGVSLRVPREATARLLEILHRSLPPRLARVIDLSGDHRVLHVLGPDALAVATKAGVAIPAEGRIWSAVVGGMMALVSRPADQAPFAIEILTSAANAPAVRARLHEAGAHEGSVHTLELARILRGWPRLGAEIDDRTLPQEVRFDELGGVSYTKGCYVGQETVARLHFRGHANRVLRGLVWEDPPDADQPLVSQDDKPRGRVTSLAWVHGLDRWIGLGILRREVDPERAVLACGQPATISPLPFPMDA
jgi:folate-binding protein YgfZ